MTSLATLSALPTDFAIPLRDNMIISLKGEQSDSYLHGQITVNVNKLSEGNARHYAHCDNKGKTWSVGYVMRHKDALLMLTNADAGAHSLAQLNKYGVFSKVDITDATNDFTAILISQSAASKLLGDIFPTTDFSHLPPSWESNSSLFAANSEYGVVFNSGFQRGAVIAVLTKEAAQRVMSRLEEQQVCEYDQVVFNALQIESAHATLDEENVAEYVPQMINMHALHAIDFDKGCYMGQEVVARTRFLGKNKRAAYPFKLSESVEISSQETLEKQLGDNWRVAGKIISSATLANETWLMAVLTNDTQSQDLHRLTGNHEITCYPIDLPYDIEQQASNIVRKRR
ncbi:tRNA-modifying protein YgfZ [Alteromonas sp. D210916BOD_24]|uniref:CAF17-like 4Fe-4S cluster assembly/insertion protein YgfZ n=1 Tax=Alteromonas sp. D210916BOD_24 TaxID=3157618 RepID=UPI00399CEFFC